MSSCQPHNQPSDYIEEADRNRYGWTRSVCKHCGKFIGYRKSKDSGESVLDAAIERGEMRAERNGNGQPVYQLGKQEIPGAEVDRWRKESA